MVRFTLSRARLNNYCLSQITDIPFAAFPTSVPAQPTLPPNGDITQSDTIRQLTPYGLEYTITETRAPFRDEFIYLAEVTRVYLLGHFDDYRKHLYQSKMTYQDFVVLALRRKLSTPSSLPLNSLNSVCRNFFVLTSSSFSVHLSRNFVDLCSGLASVWQASSHASNCEDFALHQLWEILAVGTGASSR